MSREDQSPQWQKFGAMTQPNTSAPILARAVAAAQIERVKELAL
jgi:hypothetical protein